MSFDTSPSRFDSERLEARSPNVRRMHVDVEDLLAILTRELDLDEGDITEESTAADVELWDSLGHLRVCMALEERYGVQIPMEEVGELQSVPAILKYLADK